MKKLAPSPLAEILCMPLRNCNVFKRRDPNSTGWDSTWCDSMTVSNLHMNIIWGLSACSEHWQIVYLCQVGEDSGRQFRTYSYRPDRSDTQTLYLEILSQWWNHKHWRQFNSWTHTMLSVSADPDLHWVSITTRYRVRGVINQECESLHKIRRNKVTEVCNSL